MIGLLRGWRHGRLRRLLSTYVDGSASGPERARVEAHLSGCEACRMEADTLRATIDLLAALPEAVPSRSFALEREPWPVPSVNRLVWAARVAAPAAALLLVALVVGNAVGIIGGGDGLDLLGGMSEEEARVEKIVTQEVVKEVPVETIIEKEVVREVPVEKIVEVEKEVVRTVEVKVPVEVVKEVVKEVEVPGETVVVEVEKEVVREVPVEVVVEKEVVRIVEVEKIVVKEAMEEAEATAETVVKEAPAAAAPAPTTALVPTPEPTPTPTPEPTPTTAPTPTPEPTSAPEPTPTPTPEPTPTTAPTPTPEPTSAPEPTPTPAPEPTPTTAPTPTPEPTPAPEPTPTSTPEPTPAREAARAASDPGPSEGEATRPAVEPDDGAEVLRLPLWEIQVAVLLVLLAALAGGFWVARRVR